MISATSFRLNKMYLIRLISGRQIICKVLFIGDKSLIVNTSRYDESEIEIFLEDIENFKPRDF